MEKVITNRNLNGFNGEQFTEQVTDQKDSISTSDQKVAHRFRKLKIDPSFTAILPSAVDTKEHDYDEHTTESDDNERGIRTQYVRLNEEQHVEAVVILKNDGTKTGPDEMEDLLQSNGKLKFNLTPEQLGGIAGGSATMENRSIPRKSSLRRNSVFSNQSDLEKQLVMEKPKPIPEPAGMYDVPKRILMPMFSEDQDFMDMNSFYDRNAQLKFDEILTVFDQFPMDFLPSKYKCGVCKKLCHEPRVLDCLHTFCKRCLIELEANSNSGSNLFWRRINECANFDWDSKVKSGEFEEQRSQNARTAIDFAEEIINEGNEIENLIFVSILLKRFEQCLRSNRALDFKVTDTLEFLPDEMTPCFRVQNLVPLYGIITTQKADPRKCSLVNCAELAGLKVHRKVELSLVTKDYEGRPMNHGGITVQTDLRHQEDDSRPISLNVADNRNGTYGLSFVPERAGVMSLMVSVDGKIIEGCPYVLRIHNLRPHNGVYHCCSFCSSNGSKYSTCACGSIMPGGYRGCGHGHEGHPGQRHWSCCASLLEHSDCTTKKVK